MISKMHAKLLGYLTNCQNSQYQIATKNVRAVTENVNYLLVDRICIFGL